MPDGPGLTDDHGDTRSATRGVPMGYRLSALLAELIGRCMEAYVRQRAAVRIIRVVDDICLLTPDPDAAVAAQGHVTAFFQTCGLTLNDDKFGVVCVGGELPAAMAGPLPRWGMLTLDQRGEWSVHEAAFQQHLAQSRGSVMAAGAVLSKVDIINADLTHLARGVALGADLGDGHRARPAPPWSGSSTTTSAQARGSPPPCARTSSPWSAPAAAPTGKPHRRRSRRPGCTGRSPPAGWDCATRTSWPGSSPRRLAAAIASSCLRALPRRAGTRATITGPATTGNCCSR
ncbi:reverse transcriptase domain-containing protein [Catellatospora coxensis]